MAQPLYVAAGLSFLPGFLTTEFSVRRSTTRDSLDEIIVAELGDSTFKSPFLIARSSNNDLAVYAPYHDSAKNQQDASLRFLKVPCPFMPEAPREGLLDELTVQAKERLIAIADFQGLSVVILTGSTSHFILKTSASHPQVVSTQDDGLLDICASSTTFCARGTAHLDSRASVLVSSSSCSLMTRRAAFASPNYRQRPTSFRPGQWRACSTARASNTLRSTKLATVSSFRRVSKLGSSYQPMTVTQTGPTKVWMRRLDKNLHSSRTDISLLPQGEQDEIALLDRTTWTVTDTCVLRHGQRVGKADRSSYSLEPNEVIISIKTMSLEVSEHTHKHQEMIVVGTAILRGEDLATQGSIYVFEVPDVVPEPDHPETGRKLRLFAKVKERGAVTALAPIGEEGFLLVVQGQKCLVRGLKEDHTLQPVAFLDVQCYTNVIKVLRGTGLCAIGDATQGLWLAGYMVCYVCPVLLSNRLLCAQEEPYALKPFSKAASDVNVVAAEFFPDGRALQILVADMAGTLHVLQFDPHSKLTQYLYPIRGTRVGRTDIPQILSRSLGSACCTSAASIPRPASRPWNCCRARRPRGSS